MAIDRSIFYYTEWVIMNIGWKMRLEIRPAGPAMNTLTPTYKRLERTVVELGTMKINFNDIVVGMMNAPSLTIDMEFQNEDANFDELIRNQFYEHEDAISINGVYYNLKTTNLYVILSDCGSGGDPDTIIYCGAQSNQLGNKFKYNPSTGQLYSATIETFDLLKVILDTTPTQWLCDYIIDNFSPAYTVSNTFQFYDWIRSNTEFKFDSFGGTVELWYIRYVFNEYLSGLLGYIQGFWTRIHRIFTDGVDPNISGHPLAHLTFYRQTVGSAHTAGTALSSDNLLFMGRVGGESNPIGGMLIKDKGNESLLSYQYLTDLIRNIAEGFFCKFMYAPCFSTAIVSGTTLNYNLYWKEVFVGVHDTIDLTTIFGRQVGDEAEIETGYNSLNIAEGELPNMTEPNMQVVETRNSAADGSPTWNYRLVFHNLPTFPTDQTWDTRAYGDNKDFRIKEQRINLRKILYRDTELANSLSESFDYFKVHERTTISSGVLTGGTNISTAIPVVKQFSKNQSDLKAWTVYTQQTNNLAVAINDLVMKLYNNESILKLSGEFLMDENYFMPYYVGERVICPVPSMFHDFEQGYMVLETEANLNSDGGSIKCEFVTIAGV